MAHATHVELRVPADSAFVSTLRTVTVSLGARCDLTVDQIEDLRIAVDEACALLLPHAVPGAQLTATFTLELGALRVVVRVPAAPTATPDRSGFAWTVLSALTDELSIHHDAGQLSMSLRKHRLVRDR